MHWVYKYLGQKWTPEHNCYYWFRRIMVEQFGCAGLPPDVTVNAKASARVGMREITSEAIETCGWIKTEEPKEGDAVLLAEGRRSSHIGVVAEFKGKLSVVHARLNCGVVLSDALALKFNNLKVVGYWKYENTL